MKLDPKRAEWVAELLQEVAKGKTLQLMSTGWKDVEYADFSANKQYYRIKPEPVTGWAVMKQDTMLLGWYSTKGQAETAQMTIWHNIGRVVQMKEIVDEA